MPSKGQTHPYRPMPRDFVETFERVGWEHIMDECRAGRATVMRWIAEHDAEAVENGQPLLRDRRRSWLEAHYAVHQPGRKVRGWTPGRQRPKRYVLGRTLTTIIGPDGKR